MFQKRADSRDRDETERSEIEEKERHGSVRGISVCSIKTDYLTMANFDRSHGKTRLENKISSEAK